MKQEETVDFHIRKAWQKILRMYNLEAAKYGSTMSVGYILLNIDISGTPSTQLGPKMGIEKSSLSRTLKHMEEAGLIYRKAGSDDRRVIRIFLTPYGVNKRKLAKQAVLDFNNKVFSQIDPQKLVVFREVIEEITEVAINYEKNEEVSLNT